MSSIECGIPEAVKTWAVHVCETFWDNYMMPLSLPGFDKTQILAWLPGNLFYIISEIASVKHVKHKADNMWF